MDIRFPDKGGIGSLGGKGTVPSPLQQQILEAVQHNTSVIGPLGQPDGVSGSGAVYGILDNTVARAVAATGTIVSYIENLRT